MPKAEHNIELQCTLCKKNPKFSDVSHLLTHIASKSHLATHFNLQIKSQSDMAARQALAEFDFWYRTSNIGILLADRMAMKEQKQTRKSRKSTSSHVSIKEEVEQPSAQETMRSTPFAKTPVRGFRAPVPRMHLWPEAANNTSLDDDWEPRSMYDTPSATRPVPNFPRQETPPLADSASKLDPGLTTPWKPNGKKKGPNDDENEVTDKSAEKITDSAKLKGVIWPGMDLFDAATPELKRKRNQKKDGTNIEQMLSTSRDTEPFEHSYHANGEFRASRDVFGPPSEPSSPEIPSPKKRKARKTTAALSNKSTNAPCTRAPRVKKYAAGLSQKQAASIPPSMMAPPPSMYQPPPTLNPLTAGFGRTFMTTAEEDEEFKLTIGDMGKKKGFSIFQDTIEASPARTETPLEEHRFDFQSHGVPAFSNAQSAPSRFPVSPTPAAKPAPYRPFGKENGQPEQPTQQQARRTLSGPPPHIYPSDMFRDPSSINNPLYNHAYSRSFGGFSQAWSYNDYSTPFNQANPMLGGFKSGNPSARSQQQPGQGMGSQNNNNGYDTGMHYNQ